MSLEVTISDFEQYEKIIEINVPVDDLKPKFDEAYNKYKKTIQLDGFRKGRVPIALIKKSFGLKIETEVAEKVMTEYLQQAVKDNNIKIHDVSKLESFDYNRENGLTFKTIIKIEPDVELTKYKKLDVEREIYKTTDDDLKEALENMREQHATMINVDDEAKEGHYIVADLQKTDAAGHPLIGEKYENRYIKIGGNNGNDHFTDQLIGVKAGEVQRVTFTEINPETGEDKVEYFSCHVKEVKQKDLPDLNDEFAKDLGDYKDLETLKESLRNELEKQIKVSNKQNLYNNLTDALVKSNHVDLPEFMIEDTLDAFVENTKKNSKKKFDEQELRNKYRTDAIWSLKWMLLKDKIAEIENISVEDSDIEKHIEEQAEEAGMSAERIRRDYKNNERREQIMREILDEKILQFLLKHAKVTEKIVTYKDMKKSEELIT